MFSRVSCGFLAQTQPPPPQFVGLPESERLRQLPVACLPEPERLRQLPSESDCACGQLVGTKELGSNLIAANAKTAERPAERVLKR